MLLFICFATLIKSTPILRRIFLSEKKGFWGTFYKGAPSFSKNHHHHKLFFFFSNLKSIHPTPIKQPTLLDPSPQLQWWGHDYIGLCQQAASAWPSTSLSSSSWLSRGDSSPTTPTHANKEQTCPSALLLLALMTVTMMMMAMKMKMMKMKMVITRWTWKGTGWPGRGARPGRLRRGGRRGSAGRARR